MNLRPACASSMRRSTCVPKYGAGLGLRTVAWISCNSSVGACAERLSPMDSLTDNMGHPFLGSGSICGPDPGQRLAAAATRPCRAVHRRPCRPFRESWPALLRNLVQHFLDGLADLFEPFGLGHGEVGRSDVPAIRLDLVV